MPNPATRALPAIALLATSLAATLQGLFGQTVTAGVGNLGQTLGQAFGTLQSPGGGDSSLIEEALAAALDPIEFQYGFFQATGGLAFTF